jgi:hypothetical protein
MAPITTHLPTGRIDHPDHSDELADQSFISSIHAHTPHEFIDGES